MKFITGEFFLKNNHQQFLAVLIFQTLLFNLFGEEIYVSPVLGDLVLIDVNLNLFLEVINRYIQFDLILYLRYKEKVYYSILKVFIYLGLWFIFSISLLDQFSSVLINLFFKERISVYLKCNFFHFF